MKTFLDQLAQEILKRDGSDFSDLCVVLPNRRAGVFLRDALSKIGKRAIWAPKILSIEDFVFQLSGCVKIDQTTLLFAFYQVYRKKVKDPQSLELFANWAPMFLSDINEVDINLVDAKDIFAQLYSIERISKWNPSGDPKTEFQQKHLDFVKSFYELYSTLRNSIEQENKAYQGMAFRKVAENPVASLAQCEWSKVWFAGFNALTVSEEEIMQFFLDAERAEMFWDADEYYTNDPMHEAGFYLRKYQKGKGRLKLDAGFKWKQKHLSGEPKEIHLIAAQRSVAQAEAASSILNEKWKKGDTNVISNTAVVLNDEKLLLPLLNTLPTQLTGVNITMGYGLQYSQTAMFVDKLFQLYIGASNTSGEFYYQDVLSVLTDGVYLSVSKRDSEGVRRTIIDQKRSYLAASGLMLTEFDKVIFGLSSLAVTDFLELVKNVTSFIREQWNDSGFVLESKFVSLLERLVLRLSDLQTEFGGIESLKTLHVFWRQLVNGQQLDFVGEPIGGLQVMGMLETRNLDFEELIILGVNEGSLPSNAHASSYFTFDIRRAFGLSCQNERDAVTAYHFYRLMQRAKKVYLIYDQDTTSFGGGEISRYVQQLKMEAPKNILIKDWSLNQKLVKSNADSEISIEKGEKEFEKLRALAEKGFSPSALNMYRSCGLKFYFRYIAGFKEDAVLNESVDHATFGTAVHDTLESLYKPFLGRPITKTMLAEMQANSEATLKKQFAKHVPIEEVLVGKNLLAFQVAGSYVKRVLNHDLALINEDRIVTPISLEQTLKGSVALTVDGENMSVNLKGMADRIDRLSDGTIRVIDYKTGSFEKYSVIKSSDMLESSKADHAFQLLLYAFMFSSDGNEDVLIQPTVFYLRAKNIERPIEVMEEKVELPATELPKYAQERVTELLNGLFNRSVSFSQTEDSNVCKFCDFKGVCQR